MSTMLALLSSLALGDMPDPAYAINLTLFHEYPPQFEQLGLVNQDTGDLRGDAYFALRGFMLPVECASSDPLAHFDCDNPEQNASDINVVSQHLVTADSRFGPYGACNEQDGKYTCVCNHGRPCGAAVGNADVYTREPAPPAGSEDWRWWRVNLARKTGGNWYSTHAAGECTESGPGGGAAGCTWKVVENARRITSRCLLGRVATAVASQNATCFNLCAQPTNLSSVCWVDCFMATALGPAGGERLIDGDKEGVNIGVLIAAWQGAFAAVASGGCPDAYHANGALRTDEPTVREVLGKMLRGEAAAKADGDAVARRGS